eukprot:1117388-Rhodomonas_salina.1
MRRVARRLGLHRRERRHGGSNGDRGFRGGRCVRGVRWSLRPAGLGVLPCQQRLGLQAGVTPAHASELAPCCPKACGETAVSCAGTGCSDAFLLAGAAAERIGGGSDQEVLPAHRGGLDGAAPLPFRLTLSNTTNPSPLTRYLPHCPFAPPPCALTCSASGARAGAGAEGGLVGLDGRHVWPRRARDP